jgi:hypothetical protein
MSQVNDLMFAFFRGLGYTGALPDMRYEWLKDNGYSSMRAAMAAEGFSSGSIADFMFSFFGDAAFNPLSIFAENTGQLLNFNVADSLYSNVEGRAKVSPGDDIRLVIDQSKGAKSLEDTGTPELFDISVTTYFGEAESAGGDAIRIYSSAGSNSFSLNSGILTAGDDYAVILNVDSITVAGSGIRLGDAGPIIDEVGEHVVLFTAESANFAIKRTSGATDIQISGISVKSLPGIHATRTSTPTQYAVEPVNGIRNELPYSAWDSATPTGWGQLTATGSREHIAEYEAVRFYSSGSGVRPAIFETISSLPAATDYVLYFRVEEVAVVPSTAVVALVYVDSNLVGEADYDDAVDGLISVPFNTGGGGDFLLRIGLGVSQNSTGDITLSRPHLQKAVHSDTSYQRTNGPLDITDTEGANRGYAYFSGAASLDLNLPDLGSSAVNAYATTTDAYSGDTIERIRVDMLQTQGAGGSLRFARKTYSSVYVDDDISMANAIGLAKWMAKQAGVSNIDVGCIYGDSFANDRTDIGDSIYSRGLIRRGVSGASVATIRSGFDATYSAALDFVILQGGINSINSGVPLASMQSDFSSMLGVASGDVAVINVTPWANSAAWSAPEQTVTESLNSWLATNYGGKIIDAYAELGDSVNTDELDASFDSGDGLHPNAAGYDAIDDLIVALFGW